MEEDIELPVKKPIEESTTIGIDLGLKHFLITSTGEKIDNPRCLRKLEKKLKEAQRRLSRKKKLSSNRRKQKIRVAKIHEKISNQRNDFLHKLTRRLVDENQINTFCLETLNINGMNKNHSLAKSINDASWAIFNQYLKYKCEWAGKNIIKMGKYEPSSKKCNMCGWINKKLELKDREWICKCVIKHNRDINAAINIKQIGLGKPEFTLGGDRSK